MALPEVGLTAVIENMDDFERAADQIEQSYDDIIEAAIPVGIASEAVSETFDAVAASAEEAGSSVESSASVLGAIGDVAAGIATGGLSLLFDTLSSIGEIMLGVITAGPRFATEIGGAMNMVAAQTGAGAEEMEGFREAAEDVFEMGLGETFEDVAQAMAQIERTTGMSGEALEALTANALTLQEVFDVDVNESIRAANRAMSEFGTTGSETFDLITVALQQTGDPADDLLDTINEYSANFEDAGFSAEQMIATLVRGLEAGAFNFDVVADAVREFNIRLIDGSQTTSDAIEALTGDAEGFLTQISEGTLTGAEAMEILTKRLAEIEDPIQRGQLGVALFGSKWEDVGEGAILALGDIETGLGDVEGATQRAQEAAGVGLGQAWERLTRTLQTSLADGFGPILTTIVEKVTPAFESFAEWLDGPGREVLETFGEFVSENLGAALENLGPFIQEKVIPALEDFASWMMDEGIPALEDFVEWFKKELIPWVAKTAKWVKEKLLPTLARFGKFLSTLIKIAKTVIKPLELIGESVMAMAALFTDGKDIIAGAMEDAQEIVEDAKEKITDFFEKLKDDVLDIIDRWVLGSIAKIEDLKDEAIRLIADFVSDAVAKFEDLKDRVTERIEKLKDDAIRLISDLVSSIVAKFDELVSDVVAEVERLKDEVVGSISDMVSEVIGKIGELVSSVISEFEGLKSDIAGIWSDIQATAAQAWDDFKQVVSEKVQEAVDFVVDKLGELPSQVAGFASDLVQAASDMMQGLIDGITQRAQEISETLTSTVQSAIDSLLNLLASAGQLGARLLSVGSDMIQRILDGIGQLASQVGLDLQTAITGAVDALPDLLGEFGAIGSKLVLRGKEVITRIIQGIVDLVGGENPIFTSIKNTVTNAINSLGTALTAGQTIADNIIQAGKDLVQRIIDGIGDMSSQFWLGLVTVINDGFEAIFGFRPFPEPGGSSRSASMPAMRSLGGAMVSSMAQGVIDSSGVLASAMAHTVNSALIAAQRAAGTRSPSTIFAEVGTDIGRGLQVGLASQIPAVSAQLSAMVSAPAQVAAPALGAGNTTTVTQVFNLGGNTFQSQTDDAIFEARVLDIIRRNL